MANATIYTKTLVGGNSKCVILEPGMEFKRQTNIPANWRTVRIAMIGSFTNLVSPNGTPTGEVINAASMPPTFAFNFGLSNGVGYIGDAGNRFVGMGNSRTAVGATSYHMANYLSNWTISASATTFDVLFSPVIGDGVTVTNVVGTNLTTAFKMGDPSASDNCMFGMAFNLDLSTGADGRLTPTSNIIGATPTGDDSDQKINNMLIGTPFTSPGYNAANGGWWTMNGVTPVDCTYISIRAPQQLNRLRIHNLMIQQIL